MKKQSVRAAARPPRGMLSPRARRWFLLLLEVVVLTSLTLVVAVLTREETELEVTPLRLFRPTELAARVEGWRSGPSRFLAGDGSELAQLELERCSPVAAQQLSFVLRHAFLAAEAGGPCGHPGSLEPLLAALGQDTTHWNDALVLRDQVPGRSALEVCSLIRATLFQREAPRCEPWIPLPDGSWLALDDPDALLLAHLNLVALGEGVFGVAEGARTWFDREPSKLRLAEAAYLAARAAFPEERASASRLKRARDRVLARMLEQGFIAADDLRLALAEPVPVGPAHPDPRLRLGEYLSHTVRELEGQLSGHPAIRRGLTVHTPFDPVLQDAAQRAISRTSDGWFRNRKKEVSAATALLNAYSAGGGESEEEEGEGPELMPGTWTELPRKGTSPATAVVSLEPTTGRVRLLLEVCEDCRPQERGVFRRHRQPGSAWKPFVYAAAIERGMNQVMIVPDRRFTYEVRQELWSPKNHEDHYYGQVPARRALAQSMNSVAIQLIFRVGPQRVVELARRLGITSRIVAVPALALGTPPVSLVELTRAYATFPSSGQRVPLRFVDRVEDARGRMLPWKAAPPGPQVLDPRVAYVMVNMLQEVATSGTAAAARRLGFPVGGKTGTTNESKDAWFVGFSDRLITGVWVGFPNKDPLGGSETGGTLALPVWMEVMKTAAKTSAPGEFPVPPGVVLEPRSPWNGQPWAEGRLVAFIGEPTRPCVEGGPPNGMPEQEGADQRRDRLRRLEKLRRGGDPYRCRWKPVEPQTDGQADAASAEATPGDAVREEDGE